MRRCAASASTVNIALCTSALRTLIGMVSTVPATVCWESGMHVTVVRLLRQPGADLVRQVDGRVVSVLARQREDGDLHGFRATAGREFDHAAGQEAHAVGAGCADLGEAGL